MVARQCMDRSHRSWWGLQEQRAVQTGPERPLLLMFREREGKDGTKDSKNARNDQGNHWEAAASVALLGFPVPRWDIIRAIIKRAMTTFEVLEEKCNAKFVRFAKHPGWVHTAYNWLPSNDTVRDMIFLWRQLEQKRLGAGCAGVDAAALTATDPCLAIAVKPNVVPSNNKTDRGIACLGACSATVPTTKEHFVKACRSRGAGKPVRRSSPRIACRSQGNVDS